MRIAIGSIVQEGNTFAPTLTGLREFEADLLCYGEELLDNYRDMRVEVGGFLKVLAEAGAISVPLLAARACAGGPLTRAAMDHLVGELVARLRAALPVDAVLLSLHGAMVVEDEPEVLFQPYEMLELFPLLGQLKKRADELRVRIWPGNNIGYFGPYESVLKGTMPRGHMASCGAGRSTLGIEADGAIKGCPSLPTEAWTGGNIRDNSLRDIWERSAPLRYTRDRTVEDLWGYCRTCYYADECRAGCTWTSFVFFGRAGNNPYCHHRALEMQRKGVREVVSRVEMPPGAPFDHGKFEIREEPL